VWALAALAAAATAVAAVVGVAHLGRSEPKARPVAMSGTQPGRPGAARPAAADPAAVHRGWRLTFDARFRGSHLDTATWSTCYPWLDVPSGCRDFGNREQEWYLPTQVRVSGGVLRLVARHKRTEGRTAHGAPKLYYCRSGMVTSYPGLRFRYGYLQAVAKIPPGRGLWPALWLAAANLRWPPEVDMIEHWGRRSHDNGVFLHPLGGPRVAAWPVISNLGVGWHTFGLLWKRDRMTWFIDGRTVLSVHSHVPRQRMYLVADLADFWLPPTGACSGEMLLKSVRLWQR
jgi:beta-glucanase (GH16 family)